MDSFIKSTEGESVWINTWKDLSLLNVLLEVEKNHFVVESVNMEITTGRNCKYGNELQLPQR